MELVFQFNFGKPECIERNKKFANMKDVHQC